MPILWTLTDIIVCFIERLPQLRDRDLCILILSIEGSGSAVINLIGVVIIYY